MDDGRSACSGSCSRSSLRNKLIVVEELPFPTGTATAEVIETIHAARDSALHRARLLSVAGIASMYVAWFRDGPSGLIPQMWAPAITIGGMAAANLGIGVSWSPLLASTGVLMGLRGAASMLLGAALTWLVIAPRLFHAGWSRPPEYSAFVSWLVWPAVGMMLPSAFLPLILDWRSAWRSVRDLSSMLRARSARRRARAAAGAAAEDAGRAVPGGAGRRGACDVRRCTRC